MPLNAVVELPDSGREELARWLRAPSMLGRIPGHPVPRWKPLVDDYRSQLASACVVKHRFSHSAGGLDQHRVAKDMVSLSDLEPVSRRSLLNLPQ